MKSEIVSVAVTIEGKADARVVCVGWHEEITKSAHRVERRAQGVYIPLEVFEQAAARFQKSYEAPRAYYIVQVGDTLAEIARRFNWYPEKLAARNNIENPDRIRVGQRIWLSPADVEF